MPKRKSDAQPDYEKLSTLNKIFISQDAHSWLKMEANRLGMGIEEFSAFLIEKCAAEWEVPTKSNNVDVQMLWNEFEIRRMMKRQRLAKSAADRYIESPSEFMANKTARQCELAGLDYNEVLSTAENDPFTSIINYETNDDSLFGKCVRWIIDFLYANGSEVSANVLKTVGSRHSFTESMIERAKRRINSMKEFDKRIDSHRNSSGWTWRLVNKSVTDPSIEYGINKSQKIEGEKYLDE